MTVHEIKNKMVAKAKGLTIQGLCDGYTLLIGNHSPEAPEVRGVIMDELEARDPKAFESWIMAEDLNDIDNPGAFFIG